MAFVVIIRIKQTTKKHSQKHRDRAWRIVSAQQTCARAGRADAGRTREAAGRRWEPCPWPGGWQSQLEAPARRCPVARAAAAWLLAAAPGSPAEPPAAEGPPLSGTSVKADSRYSRHPRAAPHSLGLRTGREQCWSSQDSTVRCSSSRLLVDTIPLKDSNSGLMMTLNCAAVA